MAGEIVIRAEGIGKKFLIGHKAERERYVVLRDVLTRTARAGWRKMADLASGRPIVAGDRVEEFWALRDVNFEVRRGEVLGIIGRNGAGKSTLLKILSRIIEPTEGRVTIDGRVASLLEVGTGFHPELSGRENIYLNGAILGMSRMEIRRKFDEIVAFSEVEKFLDTPVKRYSSGMYVRLAFAVAAHLEPDILVVDEVLSVGDGDFQKKCLGKMDEVAHAGRTVLFVSHTMKTVAALCSHGLLLDGGTVLASTTIRAAIELYESPLMQRTRSAANVLYERSGPTDHAPCVVTRVEMLDAERCPVPMIPSYQAVIFRIWFRAGAAMPTGSVVLMISDMAGTAIAKFETHPRQVQPVAHAGDRFVDCCVDHLALIAGRYSIGAGVALHGVRMIDWGVAEGALVVGDPVDADAEMSASPQGPLAMRHRWHPGVCGD